MGVYIGLLYPEKKQRKKAAWVEEPLSCFCCCRFCTLPATSAMSHPPPLSCPTHGCSFFVGGVWVAGNYGVAFGAAAVRAHGLGDRKELSASHKQDSSCTHDTRDPDERHPFKTQCLFADDLVNMNHKLNTQ